MTLAELERLVVAHAPGSLLPRDWLLQQIQAIADPVVGDELANLSIEDAGQVLDRSTSTVREYCRSGLLPGAYRQRGREWRIPRGAIRAFQRSEAVPKARPPLLKTEEIDLGAWREELS